MWSETNRHIHDTQFCKKIQIMKHTINTNNVNLKCKNQLLKK